MAEETENRREQQSGRSQSRHTPRKVNPDGGGINQTDLRDDIARHMRDEMLICSVPGFLEKLAPFSPSPQWIQNARTHLTKKKLLGTRAETTLPVEVPQRRSTRNSARAGVVAPTGASSHDVNAVENVGKVQWAAYRDTTPDQMPGTEMETFHHLEEIVTALRGCPDPDTHPDRHREWNGYDYKDCPGNTMKSDILGAGFKVDAAITNPDIYKTETEAIPFAAAQTAVVMEFKKSNKTEKVSDNRKQLVAAANHIMNDDPCRNWMYGVTIENTEMSLWYFSRSYSMKSAPFDFTTEFDTFIRVFLSFLYAKRDELGHDPSISREYYNRKWCYIYELREKDGKDASRYYKRYYRTIEPLYNPRSFCITGRKSRVWKVIEINGLADLGPKSGAREAVLKDCWVNQGSLSEKEIQDAIFGQLKNVKEADYAWAPESLKRTLKSALAHPETYFMKVVLDSKGTVAKEKPEWRADPNLLSVYRTAADPSKVISSTQTPPPTAYPSPHTSNTATPDPTIGRTHHEPREYRVKQHYRVVYTDVGQSLAYAASLSDAIKAIEDILIALTLLFLAGWVHRDVSEGNIILVRGANGGRAKLSDLEYARFYNQEDVVPSPDPKTGTPYFMPLEIHKGAFIFDKPESDEVNDVSLMTKKWQPGSTKRKPAPRHNFAHDMESLWWIIAWIIFVRIKGAKWIWTMIFTVLGIPHPDRESFFKNAGNIRDRPADFGMSDTLQDCNAHLFLAIYSHSLCKFYSNGDRQNPTAYRGIYITVWNLMEFFLPEVSAISMELEDPSKRPPPSPVSWMDPQGRGKRSRSINNDEASGREMTAGASSSRKRQKPGGDVITDTAQEDTDQEDMDEEDKIEDMAGIVREDSNPRIRSAWD